MDLLLLLAVAVLLETVPVVAAAFASEAARPLLESLANWLEGFGSGLQGLANVP